MGVDFVERGRLLVLMGSGETSPTMVTVHREAAARAGSSAVLLETPYGFQENVADISARAQAYFARSVGIEVEVAPGLRGADAPTGETARGLAKLRGADWVFCGPGSPTYALSWWQGGPVGDALRDRMAGGAGVTVFASAAACTLGRFAVPVYEVYKVGAAPHWIDGLDLLSNLGLSVAVIPHYDNTEGGNHDTRFCYLGERRLARMERELPSDCAVLGLDEHTAAIIEPDADRVRVRGRGRLTIRRDGVQTELPSGTVLPLTELRALVAGRRSANGRFDAGGRGSDPTARPDHVPTLVDDVREAQRRFDEALEQRRVSGMVRAILDLDAAIAQWSADTEEDAGTPQARIVLCGLIVRMGETVRMRDDDDRAALAPVVEPLLRLRTRMRCEGAFAFADAVRAALGEGGVEVRDEDSGVSWRPSTRAADTRSNDGRSG